MSQPTPEDEFALRLVDDLEALPIIEVAAPDLERSEADEDYDDDLDDEDLNDESEEDEDEEAERADLVDEDDEVLRAMDDNQLKHYWTRGKGLAKWANRPHGRWTALYRHLRKYVGSERAKRMAADWFHEVFGYWPGHQKGDNPVGPG